MKKQHFFIITLSLSLVFAAVMAATILPLPETQKTAPVGTSGLEGLGGSWDLVDHNSKVVTDKDFSGHYRLMFFGFTACPDVCPTELKRLTLVLEGLGADAAELIPLFVSVDPERDTPEVLKEYLSRFDPRFMGLTGTVPQIEHMEKIFKVYAAKTEDPDYTEYMVNHSALVYLIDPEDKVVHLFHSQDTPDDMVARIRQFLKHQG